ncbi:MAG: DUF3888 domain-containing protein [Clostridium sp.]
MKRNIITFIVATFVSSMFFFSYPVALASDSNSSSIINAYTNFESNEYNEAIVVLLYPYISRTIENIYGEKLAFDPYATEITSLSRLCEGCPEFRIKLKLYPYSGAHNTVGVDSITIKITPGSEPVVEGYTHIKSK